MTWGRDTDAGTKPPINVAPSWMKPGNFLDTAAGHGDGDSERVIGGLIGMLLLSAMKLPSQQRANIAPLGEPVVDTSRIAYKRIR